MASPSPPTAAGGGSPFSDEAIWKRLQEAGFDEEAIKRRDKASLISYITKLETELYDYQHNMGLLILERKESISKYEQLKSSAESAEIAYKRDQAAKLSSLAESRRREEGLKKALGIEKECVANIEKALHDMRAVSAETKLAYDSKLAEAYSMMESAQKKFEEAESKFLAAESLRAEASRSRNTTSRNLDDIEARENELRRLLSALKSEREAKEKEMNIQKQSLYETQKILHQEQERLVEGQSLLNQREEYIYGRSKELSCIEKELEEAKQEFEQEYRALKVERSNLDLDKAAIATREEAVIKRESLLDRREKELLVLQEKIASKEYDEIERLKEENQCALERKMKELEAEVDQRHMSMEDEIKAKTMACDSKEAELNQHEKFLQERELCLERQLSSLADKEEALVKRSKLLEEKEHDLHSSQREVKMEMLELEKQKAEIKVMYMDIEKMEASLKDKKDEILHAQNNFELTMSERNELLALETRLKEEIDSLRTQRKELIAEADKLKADKEKFEIEWELIDEKREELRKEAERITEERNAVGKYLKNEHDSIKLEKENLRSQFKKEAETLSCEREEFIHKMECEHSDWFNKIQKEREDFARDIMIQRKELENCIAKRREEIEAYLRGREECIEQERDKELHHIKSQKEMLAKELDNVASERRRLQNERAEIALDCEQREREWSEIKSSIELLNIQREKLQKQRELLHLDREEIHKQIQHLKKLEDLNIESENRSLSEMQPRHLNTSIWKVPVKKCSSMNAVARSIDDPYQQNNTAGGYIRPKLLTEKTPTSASPPMSGTISWIRKVIFRGSHENVDANSESNLEHKVSAKFGEVSAGNGVKPQIVYEDMTFLGQEKTGREESVRSKLKESFMENNETAITNGATKESSQLNEDGVHRGISGRKSVDGGENLLLPGRKRLSKFISQYDTDGHRDISGRRSVDGGENLLLPGRKRLSKFISQYDTDGQLEPKRKHQKKTTQTGSTSKEEILNCVLSSEATLSDDDSSYVPLIPISGCKEIPDDCTDRKQCTSKLTNSRPPNITQDAELLHVDSENQNGSKFCSHAGNRITSNSDEILEAQEHTLDNATKVAEKLMEHGEQDGCTEDNEDGVDSEDGGGIAIKE